MRQLFISQCAFDCSREHNLARKFFISFVGVIFIFAFIGAVQAQSPDKVLKQSLKSLGGEKAVKKIKSWEMKGKITRLDDGATGNYQASAMQPNYYTAFYDVNGFETAYGYNGKSGWVRDSKSGLKTLTGQASKEFQTEVSYRANRWLNAKNEKSKLTFGGQTTINGKPANTVILTTLKNVKITMYFDSATGLLMREEIPQNETLRVFDYSDYRAVDGVQEPFAINMTVDEERYEIKLEQVVHNPALAQNVFEFPRIGNEPLPDINALLKEVGKNEDKIDDILDQYTFTETTSEREIGKDGIMREKKSETFDLLFYKGNRIRKLSAKNGQPLSEEDEQEELKKVEKRLKEIEKDEAEKERKAEKEREVAQQKNGTPDPEKGKRVSIADLLRASKLVNPRRERYKERDVIVFDFEPLAGYKPKKDYEKFFGKTAGAMWIDPIDKQVVRVEARLVDAYKIGGGLVASLKKGATFVLEQERVNNEIWLPSVAEFNLSAKVLLFKSIEANQRITYNNYKKYDTSVDENIKIKVQEQKKP